MDDGYPRSLRKWWLGCKEVGQSMMAPGTELSEQRDQSTKVTEKPDQSTLSTVVPTDTNTNMTNSLGSENCGRSIESWNFIFYTVLLYVYIHIAY